MTQLLHKIAMKTRYAGRGRYCPVCEHESRHFVSHRDKPERRCPRCGSLERHRAMWPWLRDQITAGARVLHIAPEQGIQARLREMPIAYTSADLDSPLAEVHCDVMDLPFADDSFDVVLCNHVLEHVADDQRAMRELRRVLAPGGFAVLDHPVFDDLEHTLEDPSVTTPQERLRAYGQEDHARKYGRDFTARLRGAGFDVEHVELRGLRLPVGR